MSQSFYRTLSEVSSSDGSLSRSLLSTSIVPPSNRIDSRSNINRQLTPKSSEFLTKSYCKTPKTPLQKTPYKNINNLRDADRFIPNRQVTDLERGHYLLMQDKLTHDKHVDKTDLEYKQAVAESICPNGFQGDKILRFKSKQAPRPTFASLQKMPDEIRKKSSPQKLLDAPGLIDDFYLNILDWSLDNQLAIALNNEVYIWNAETGDINFLMQTALENDYVSSLIWSRDSFNVISVGTNSGRLQLWDCSRNTLIRTMRPSGSNGSSRIPVQAWKEQLISAGSRSGGISHHDVRIPSHEIGIWELHSQEVCGLSWSPDGRILASGGNDNTLAIWSSDDVSKKSGAEPKFSLLDHKAAVKAIAWCPWKPTLLCSGGGSADHHLRFWNANTGTALQSFDVGAQVSAVIWNTAYRELITSHGATMHHMMMWKYPSIDKMIVLDAKSRVLCMTASPNSEMIACCTADETLQIWNCFEIDKSKKPEDKSMPMRSAPMALR